MGIKNSYFAITGRWPENKKVKEFFNIAGIENDFGYQLFQTYSQCCIEKLNIDTNIDIKMLEQYRAFCPNWELWIRNINAKKLLFRFIGNKNIIKLVDDKKFFQDYQDQTESIKNLLIQVVSYPLWGEALSKDLSKEKTGWFTNIIPQIIQYPVEKKWNKVALNTDNFMDKDGIIKLVRFKGLIEDKGMV